jgi:hypothetical protein
LRAGRYTRGPASLPGNLTFDALGPTGKALTRE